jgi:hypothetical protein
LEDFFTKSSTPSYVIYKEISKIGVIASRNLCNQESVRWSLKALLRKGRLKASLFCWKRTLDILIQKALELIFIPSGIGLFPLHNEGGVSSDPVTKGFIDSKGGLNINQLNEEAMLIEPSQFSDPV